MARFWLTRDGNAEGDGGTYSLWLARDGMEKSATIFVSPFMRPWKCVPDYSWPLDWPQLKPGEGPVEIEVSMAFYGGVAGIPYTTVMRDDWPVEKIHDQA